MPWLQSLQWLLVLAALALALALAAAMALSRRLQSFVLGLRRSTDFAFRNQKPSHRGGAGGF
jgi:hypothetical protein